MLKVFLSTIISTFHTFWYVMTLFSLTAKYCQCPCYFFFEAIGYLTSCYLIYKHLVIFQISFSYSIFISNFNDGQETLYTIEILLFFFKLVLWPRMDEYIAKMFGHSEIVTSMKFTYDWSQCPETTASSSSMWAVRSPAAWSSTCWRSTPRSSSSRTQRIGRGVASPGRRPIPRPEMCSPSPGEQVGNEADEECEPEEVLKMPSKESLGPDLQCLLINGMLPLWARQLVSLPGKRDTEGLTEYSALLHAPCFSGNPFPLTSLLSLENPCPASSLCYTAFRSPHMYLLHACPVLLTLFMGFSRQEYWSGSPSLPQWAMFCQSFPPWLIQFGLEGFPWWLSGKEPACQCRRLGSVPGLGRSPEGGNGNPLQDSCQENPSDSGTWRATVLEVTRVRHSLQQQMDYLGECFMGVLKQHVFYSC